METKNKEIFKLFDVHNDKIYKIQKALKKQDTAIEDFKVNVAKTYEVISESDKIRAHIKTLPDKKEVEENKKIVSTSKIEFREQSEKIMKEMESHREIISRYDEVLTEKAQKSSLYDLKVTIQ